jgi:hypothetical protein
MSVTTAGEKALREAVVASGFLDSHSSMAIMPVCRALPELVWASALCMEGRAAVLPFLPRLLDLRDLTLTLSLGAEGAGCRVPEGWRTVGECPLLESLCVELDIARAREIPDIPVHERVAAWGLAPLVCLPHDDDDGESLRLSDDGEEEAEAAGEGGGEGEEDGSQDNLREEGKIPGAKREPRRAVVLEDPLLVLQGLSGLEHLRRLTLRGHDMHAGLQEPRHQLLASGLPTTLECLELAGDWVVEALPTLATAIQDRRLLNLRTLSLCQWELKPPQHADQQRQSMVSAADKEIHAL